MRRSIKGGLFALFFCMAVLLMPAAASSRTSKTGSGSKPKIESTFENPDFAFPQTVRKDAQPVYESAIKNGRPVEALQAAMELNVADRITTSDSIAVSMERYGRIARKFQAPYSSMARLLEAKLLAGVYSSNAWKFNQRVLPDSVRDAEPMLWSGAQFRSRIAELCREVLADRQSLSTAPISTVAGILTGAEEAGKNGFSVLDFATYEIIGIVSRTGVSEGVGEGPASLPFREAGVKDADAEKDVKTSLAPLALMDALIRYDEFRCALSSLSDPPQARALCEARLRKAMYIDLVPSKDPAKPFPAYVEELLAQYPEGSPLRPYVVCRLYDMGALNSSDNATKTAVYDLLKSTLAQNPTENEASLLNFAIERMTMPSYSLQTPTQWLTSDKQEIRLSLDNVGDAYLLMVPVKASFAESNNPVNNGIVANGETIVLKHIQRNVTAPVSVSDTLSVHAPKAGYYALVMSKTEDLSGMFDTVRKLASDIVNVSDITFFSTDANRDDRMKADGGRYLDKYIYVVDARTNAPLKGVDVRFTDTRYNGGGTSKGVTDGEGRVKSPYRNFRAEAEYNGSRAVWHTYGGYYYKGETQAYKASILTDLALYHPGDTINAAVIVSRSAGNRLSAAEGVRVAVELYDANGKIASSDTTSCDGYGRGVVALAIPSEGLTGRFRITAAISPNSKSGYDMAGSTSVEVADYKAPAFRVTLDAPAVTESKDGECDEIELSGNVMTYSGMPLADSDVDLTVTFRRWWRIFYGEVADGGQYGVKTVTDGNGRFNVRLLIDGADARDYSAGSFDVRAIATSAAGETQQSGGRSFTLGEGYRIEPLRTDRIRLDSDSVTLAVRVTDILSAPVEKRVSYTLTPLAYDSALPGGKALTGEFTSPSLTIPASSLPSGEYHLVAILPESYRNEKGEWRADTLDTTVTFWRADDARPPHAMPLWVPEQAYYAAPGEKYVEVSFGSGYADEYVYCMTSDADKVVKREWLRPKGENVKLRVPAPKEGEVTRLILYGMHDLARTQSSITVYPASESRKTKFEVVTFRDRLTPGALEKWQFRLLAGWPDASGGLLPQGDAAVLAVLSNDALNAITPFKWSFMPGQALNTNTFGALNTPYVSSVYGSGNLARYRYTRHADLSVTFPAFNFWGYTLGDSGLRIRGTNMMYKSMAVADNAKMEMAEKEVEMADAAAPEARYASGAVNDMAAVTDGGAEADENASPDPEESFRSMEMPLAFFRPLLATDADGVATIEFEVPDFNTTWALQLLGYNKGMESAFLTENSVASKPVMVQTLMPRFLLTGDKAQISASVFNNTEEALPVSALIEVFDLATGKLLSSADFKDATIPAGQSKIITVGIDVPSDVSALGVRSTAQCSLGRDGEQGAVQVLPSSMPVSDATTFYLTPGQENFSISLPKMNATDCVTLNYCDNPAWYVLTALSGLLTPDSDSALQAAVALYSNSVASGIIGRYPAIRKGLEAAVKGDDGGLLLSPLAKNSPLKVSALYDTPWVNNADAETLRMLGLSSLLDAKGAGKAIDACIDRLAKTRNFDGSWSWMKGMPGSEWITCQVLSALGSLRASGYLPSDGRLNSMIREGIVFADAEISKDYMEFRKNGGDKYPLSSEIDYLYIRGNAVDSKPSGTVADIMADLLKRLPGEWRDLSVMRKATAAIILQREGNPELARLIMESVGEMASYKDSKGMWFDAASEGYFAPSRLTLTSRCLDAYRSVDPANDAVEKLAQFLVLSRQTTDWNRELGQAGVAEVVGSLLAATADWMPSDNAPAPRLMLDGKEIPLPSDSELLTGNIYLDLDPEYASESTLTIERSGKSPAWGGVISRYVMPAAKVKAHDVPQLSVTKRLLPVEVTAEGKKASAATSKFSKGDRVRVTLTVVADRDLDYVLINDRLGAWMQPADQLTQYSAQDGLRMLRETRTSATNFYITRLPKGKHVISYEVNADRDGEYSTGIATAQSQYYPLITAHSAGAVVTVE